jgi:predicted nucleic acid-binding protein
VSRDPREETKFARARDLLGANDLALSVQVLQEFYVQSTRATRAGRLAHQEAVLLIQDMCRFPVQETTVHLMEAALETKQRFGISYWDAAVVEAARSLGCRMLLTEDLKEGQDFDGVRVVNPFA